MNGADRVAAGLPLMAVSIITSTKSKYGKGWVINCFNTVFHFILLKQKKNVLARTIEIGDFVTAIDLIVLLTYRGLSEPSYRHRKAQQGVVLIVRQSQQFGDVLESLGCSQPVQTSQSFTRRHGTSNRRLINITVWTVLAYCFNQSDAGVKKSIAGPVVR